MIIKGAPLALVARWPGRDVVFLAGRDVIEMKAWDWTTLRQSIIICRRPTLDRKVKS
jgi:hypothetical protein